MGVRKTVSIGVLVVTSMWNATSLGDSWSADKFPVFFVSVLTGADSVLLV